MTARLKLNRIFIFIILVLLTVSFVYPLFYMCINSLKTRDEFYTSPFTLPQGELAIDNYQTMISQLKIFSLFKNSFIISSSTVIFILGVGIFSSYAFAKMSFKGKRIIYLLVIATMFIPSQVTIIPVYILFARLRIVNTYFSVILSYIVLYIPEAILLLTASIKAIPKSFFEAAEIDGYGYFGKVKNIVIPMGKPAIFLAVIFYFIMSWNDLFTPMVLLQGMDKRTVMVALASLMGRYSGSPTFQFAGLLLGAIPAIIIYFIFQKQIVQGLLTGGIK